MNCQLKYGIVSEVKKGFVRVQFEEDDIVSDWLPVLVRRSLNDKDTWQLEVNEHVVCMMDHYSETGVCMGAIYNDTDRPDPRENPGIFRKSFDDGTSIEYDKNDHVLRAYVNGDLHAKATNDCFIDASNNLQATAGAKAKVTSPEIELTGLVKITGATTIVGALTCGGLSVVPSSGGSGNMDITGNMNITGSVEATVDVKAAGKSLKTHIHPGVQPGGGLTGAPQ